MKIAGIVAVVTALSTVTHLAAIVVGAYWGWEGHGHYRLTQFDSKCPQPEAVASKRIDMKTGTVTCRYFWRAP